HGAVMGVYHSSMYVGMGLIPIAAGVLSDLYGAPSTFALTSLVLAAYTIALVLLSMRTRGKV
ncbi:MAG: MFS transporter, partial [Thermoprotei archaeon]